MTFFAPFMFVLASASLGMLLADQTVAYAQQYLCVAEKSAGFAFDERTKDWKATTFRTDAKYLIAPGRTREHAFQVTKVGEDSAFWFCKAGFNENGYLYCDGPGPFKFNKRNGRFLSGFLFGYINVAPGTDERSDTPNLEIGKCSPL